MALYEILAILAVFTSLDVVLHTQCENISLPDYDKMYPGLFYSEGQIAALKNQILVRIESCCCSINTSLVTPETALTLHNKNVTVVRTSYLKQIIQVDHCSQVSNCQCGCNCKMTDWHFQMLTESDGKVSLTLIKYPAACRCVNEGIDSLEKEVTDCQTNGQSRTLVNSLVLFCVSLILSCTLPFNPSFIWQP